MKSKPFGRVQKACLRLVRLLSLLVAGSLRDEWCEEWETEIDCFCWRVSRRSPPGWKEKLNLLRKIQGAFVDALWLKKPTERQDMFFQDLRYALRSFIRKPGFAVVAGTTLAVGIGAATAIFSVLYTVVLQPLPFPQPEQLVAIWEKNPEKGWFRENAAPANYLDWKEQSTTFQSMAAYSFSTFPSALTGESEPEMVQRRQVSAEFFDVLGVRPLLGRNFTPAETWRTTERVALLGHGLWKRRFGGSREVVGQKISLEGNDWTIIGVLPASARFPDENIEVWTPFRWDPENRQAVFFRRAHYVSVIGRVKPDVSLDVAEQELNAIAAHLEGQYPETNRLMGNGLTPLHEWVVGDTTRPLLILLAAVGFLLLIACANVANLMLARAASRSRELAVRKALGAGRGRLVRQLLTESLALAFLGGLGGIAVAYGVIAMLLRLSPPELPRLNEVGINPGVLLFAFGVTLLTTLLFGLVPAIQGAGRRLHPALGSGRSAGLERGPGRIRQALVVSEIALALLLVTGAGLLIKSFYQLENVDPGFQAEGLLTFGVSLPGNRYAEAPQVSQFYQLLLEKLEALPGVESAAATRGLSMSGAGWSSDFSVEGRAPEDYGVEVVHREVTPGYFESMQVPILEGRAFDHTDNSESPRVIVINRALADRYFPGQDPLGARITFDRVPSAESIWRTVIGVVGDEKQVSLMSEARIEIFESVLQSPQSTLRVLLRVGGKPSAYLAAVKEVLHELDSQLPAYQIQTMRDVLSQSVASQRFLMLVLATFAVIALLLAAVGTYGVMAYTVHQRVPEIGVRMALGANRRDILALVMNQATLVLVLGLAGGFAAAALLTRLMTSVLFEVNAFDLPTYLIVGVVLTLVALLACFIPARRASRLDPVESLRVG